jgi:uncharacterized membrane protein
MYRGREHCVFGEGNVVQRGREHCAQGKGTLCIGERNIV